MTCYISLLLLKETDFFCNSAGDVFVVLFPGCFLTRGDALNCSLIKDNGQPTLVISGLPKVPAVYTWANSSVSYSPQKNLAYCFLTYHWHFRAGPSTSSSEVPSLRRLMFCFSLVCVINCVPLSMCASGSCVSTKEWENPWTGAEKHQHHPRHLRMHWRCLLHKYHCVDGITLLTCENKTLLYSLH